MRFGICICTWARPRYTRDDRPHKYATQVIPVALRLYGHGPRAYANPKSHKNRA